MNGSPCLARDTLIVGLCAAAASRYHVYNGNTPRKALNKGRIMIWNFRNTSSVLLGAGLLAVLFALSLLIIKIIFLLALPLLVLGLIAMLVAYLLRRFGR